MNLSRPFVLRPIGTSLLAAGILLLGFAAYVGLPVSPLPQVNLPFIFVRASEPGASPEVMAATVTTPLERQLGAIAGLTEITSSSRAGTSGIVMGFDPSRSVDGAARDVQAAINAAAPDLPAGMPSPPIYHKANPAAAPVLIMALTSPTLSVQRLYALADTVVGQRVRQVGGVGEVDVAGGANPSVRIDVNPVQLASMNLTLDNVRNAIVATSDDGPKGVISSASHQYIITANDQLKNASAYRHILIGQHDGKPIQLSQVATVRSGQEDDRQAAWFNNRRAVLLLIRKQADANVIATTDAIKRLLPDLRRQLPAGTDLTVAADRTQTIRASVNEVQLALLTSLALVVTVMFLFLRHVVPTVIAGIAVPLSIAATFGGMWLCKFSLDNLSLMALTVSVGFVVDDAIVMIENIVRHIERGEAPLRAALNGSREIGFTILSMSLSLIAVFFPLLFMGGVLGTFFVEFSATLVIAIATSMLVSLTLTPSLCGCFLHAGISHPTGRFSRASKAAFDGALAIYRDGLDWSLRHRWLMLLLTFGTLALTIGLYVIVPKGLFPEQDTGLMIGTTQASPAISFDAMSAKLKQAVSIVLRDPAVESVASYTGGSSYRSFTNRGSLFIALKPEWERTATVEQVMTRLRPRLADVVGARTYLQPVQDFRSGGRSENAQYIYVLRGTDIDNSLYKWAHRLVVQLRKSPLLEDVSPDIDKVGSQANIVINRDAASRLGVPVVAVANALNDAFSQRQVGLIYGGSGEYHVVLEASPAFRESPSDFDHTFVRSNAGASVPLSAVARLRYGVTPLGVAHQDGQPVVNISYNLAPGTALGQVLPVIQAARDAIHMPGEIRGGPAGNFKLFTQSMSQEPLLILAALITIYVVLGILYESLIHPLTILSTLPSAGLGALLALMICGSQLDVVSVIGIILLMGIVKKNAILMIDFALDAERARGLTPEQAIYEACLTRFRPIVMTSLAAMFGALPLAVGFGAGSELRVPLGIAIVGGLIVSQFLSLFTTPVFYLAFEHLAQWQRVRHARRHRGDAVTAG